MIPFTQKASNVCNYCRIRKQRCDRSLPSCSRCTAKLRSCDYSWVKDDPAQDRIQADLTAPLYGPYRACRPDLTPRGREELTKVALACAAGESDYLRIFSEVVCEILHLAGTSISGMLQEHAPSVHQWCPLVPEEFLSLGCNGMYDGIPPDGLPSPLRLLCIFLVSRRNCGHTEHMIQSSLYTTVKQILALLGAAGDGCLELFRVHALVAVYELGHGMARQAHLTLSECASLLRLVELDLRRQNPAAADEEAVLLSAKAALIMLDRMLPILHLSNQLPLACPSAHTISGSLEDALQPSIPAPSPTPCATSPRKVHIRATVALAAGRVLEYANALQYDFSPTETYNTIDDAVTLVIKKLVDKPQPHTWLHCDAIAMAFCSHLLQQAQVHNLNNKPPNYEAAVDITKAKLALHYSRCMSWDMVRVALEKVQSEEELRLLPMAGLSCVLVAGIAVLETSGSMTEEVVGQGELDKFVTILEWFEGRWGIGGELLKRAKQCRPVGIR